MQCEPICTAAGISQGMNRNLQSNREAHYTEFVARMFTAPTKLRAAARLLRNWHADSRGRRFDYTPNNIARVKARFIGGIQSSIVSANPRGHATSGSAVPKMP